MRPIQTLKADVTNSLQYSAEICCLFQGKSAWFALLGAVVLVFYGIVPTFQSARFGRVYAAYGGIFVVLSILWGWKIDHIRPDRFDLIGGLICLIGVCIIMYWPRG
jgi:small multidrug resistance family-3 protein